MDSTRARIAKWVMDNRVVVAIFFVAVTVFFAIGLRGVDFRTVFSDLLPKDDPFVQVYKDHPGFGDPLTMTIMVRRVDGGDIYNADTLQKVWDLTRDIDLAPGVDHDQILSITTEKARYAEATPYGIDMRPLMDDKVPQTEEALEDFRRRIEQSPDARTFLVSADETATIINATFIERLLDYDTAFTYAQDLVEAARDENHEVHLAGQPALTGWVFRYQMEMRWIFGVTLALLTLALIIYMRNVVGVVTPIVCSSVAAIWGLGLVGWVGSPIEPLLMVVPLLLVARSFSHCVQFTERYYEIYAQLGDRRKACEATMSVMMAPSVLGIRHRHGRDRPYCAGADSRHGAFRAVRRLLVVLDHSHRRVPDLHSAVLAAGAEECRRPHRQGRRGRHPQRLPQRVGRAVQHHQRPPWSRHHGGGRAAGSGRHLHRDADQDRQSGRGQRAALARLRVQRRGARDQQSVPGREHARDHSRGQRNQSRQSGRAPARNRQDRARDPEHRGGR